MWQSLGWVDGGLVVAFVVVNLCVGGLDLSWLVGDDIFV